MNHTAGRQTVLGPAPMNRWALDHPFPQFLFYAIVATIPFYRWRQLPGPEFMKVDWLLMGALLLVVGPYLLMQKGPPERLRSNIWLPLGLFLLANTVAYLLSPYPDQAFSGLTGLLQATLFVAVGFVMISERGFETTLPWTLGLSMGLGAFLSVLGYFFGVDFFSSSGGRAYGATISANNLALMCVFTLPLMIHWAVFGRNPPLRLMGMALAVVLVFGVFSTVSRGGFLNMMVILGLVGMQYRKRFHPKYLGLLVAAVAVTVATVVALVPDEFFERQATLVTEGTQDSSVDRRSSYLKVALDSIEERPVIGWGTDVFRKLWVRSMETRRFNMEERPAHNTYMEVVVGSGLVGLALFAFLLLRAYANYRHAERLLADSGQDREAHLVGAYKLGLVAVMLYFLIKSGLEHKYFLLALPASHAALAYARHNLAKLGTARAHPEH